MSRNHAVPEWTLNDGTEHEDCDESPCDECQPDEPPEEDE